MNEQHTANFINHFARARAGISLKYFFNELYTEQKK